MTRLLWLASVATGLLIVAACADTLKAPDLETLHDSAAAWGALAPRTGIATDDPQGEDPLLGVDGRGVASVDRFRGQQAPDRRADRRSRNLALVGHLKLDPFNEGVHADVAGYKDLAFVGKWAGPCPGTGVDIIDISDPTNPVKISSTADRSGTSMEDMQAIEIDGRDVLAVGLQNCFGVPGDDLTGLELFDISDPADPKLLSFFEVGASGVHEFDLTRTPGGRTLALLAVPNLEAFTASPPSFTDGLGDLLIVDISDPSAPTLVGDWGVLAEPQLGLDSYLEAQQGELPATFLHSVRANVNGTLAYLSYWDAGFIMLDIRDPSAPVFLGHTEYPPDAEGNAHSVVDARGGNILVGADEDFAPFRLQLQVTDPADIAGAYPAAEATFTRPIVELPGGTIAGEVVHVGRGCPDDPDAVPGGDSYLDDPSGKIALIARGACRFDNKVARAQLEGAIGAIVYDDQPGLFVMGGDNPVAAGSTDVIGTEITIPGLSVEQSTGEAMIAALDDGETVTVEASAEFVGWGFLRFFDIRDPSDPVEIGTFATDNTLDPAVAADGVWSVHNPERVGNTIYASWYSDGVRVIDMSQPSAPREIGSWTGAGAPEDAPPVFIWSVVPHRNLLLVSDMNYGLYILRTIPPGRGRE